MRYKNLDRYFFHFVTIHAFDRQADETDGRTDGQTAFSSLDRVCIACSDVKKMTLHDTAWLTGERVHIE